MTRVAVGLVLAFAVALTAQDQPSFRTAANFVRVDVFPTAKGVPVTNLTQGDFAILEDKVPQKIASFEHVVISGRVSDQERREPGTVAESRAAVSSGRARVFVLFLDAYHVEALTATKVRQPLIDTLDRALGPDDLIAVMREGMNASDLTFTAKHATVETALSSVWGQRDRLAVDDPMEDTYRACYPADPKHCAVADCRDGVSIADAMIDRRREARTIASLRSLVAYLGPAREERKAVLVLSDGWRLFTPSEDLGRTIDETRMGASSGPGLDPKTGLAARNGSFAGVLVDCERDRSALAQLDDSREAIDLEQEANRGNVTFYPIDPRGLAAYDENPSANMRLDARTGAFAAPGPAQSPRGDLAQLTARLQSLRALAESTDGMAIVQSNKIDEGMKKVAEDLSSYYLLGYNSTGKMDGKFHAISVRVNKPGIDVRARRGFLAPRPAAASSSTAIAPVAPTGALSAEAAALASAISSLRVFDRDQPLRLDVAVGWNGDTPAIWTTGEVTGEEWKGGGQVDLLLLDEARQTRATGHVTLAAGSHAFRVKLEATDRLSPGEYSVVARGRAQSGVSYSDTARASIDPAGRDVRAVLSRRGPSTANRDAPTADARFRRTDRIRVDVPAAADTLIQGKLLDRNGRVLPIPLVVSPQRDADGTEWQTMQLALAPFAPGDYVIELSTSSRSATETSRSLVAFRVIP